MADYRQTDIAGRSWQRCHRVVIQNPMGGLPSVDYHEETVLNLSNEVIRRDAGFLSHSFDPAAVIPLRDPATNGPTGDTATMAAAYQLIYSAYWHYATLRDNPPNPDPAPEG